jgi:Bacterial Ig domain
MKVAWDLKGNARRRLTGVLLGIAASSMVLLAGGCSGLVSANGNGGGNNPSPAPPTPPAPLSISNVASGQVTTTAAMVSWQTSAPATSQVEYGTSTSYGATTSMDSTLVTQHQNGVANLKAGTLYHYRVHSTDSNNNKAVSGDMTLTTASAPSTPDTTPPTVSITSPSAGATVSGTITVNANASDNVAVAGVQFKLDGSNLGAVVSASPYTVSFNTATASNGSHTLTAVATDTSNNSTTSAAVTVTVNNGPKDTTPPTVSITAPTSGATVSGTISVSANASDNVAVAGVQFKLDGSNLGAVVSASPYTVSFNTTTASNGSHTLTAVATDTSNNSTTSSAVTVTVSNGPKDTTPPTVSITAPTSGASVSGTISVSANASDNVAVANVQFKIDGSNLGAALTTAPYTASLNTVSFQNGSHSLTAVATDTSGNTATSSAVVFNISNTIVPGQLPQGLGWFDMPNTQLQSVCPPVGDNQTSAHASYNFPFYCQYVVRDWSGGIADTKRNRLILWGGGHSAYYGNELYAFDLNTLRLTRLNDPSPIADGVSCPTTLSDGKPNARHTYAGLAYIAHADKMFVYSGGLANTDGCNSNDTWTLDMATLQWKRMDPTNGGTPFPQGLAGPSVAYDPVSKLVYVQDREAFWSYNYDTNTYTQLNSAGSSLHINSVIDPKRRLFLTVGGPNDNNNGPSLLAISIATGSKYALQDWTSQVTGCDALMASASPGLQYDPVLDRIVGWPDFGNTVYLFNPDTKSCTTQTFSGGPADSAHEGPAPDSTGTYGRFQYFPAFGVYALVNDWNIDVHILRLSNSGGGTPPPTITISGVTSSNVTTSGATISWSTNVAGSSRVEYGTTTSYGQSTTVDTNLVTSHQQTLTGLSSNTLYHYRVHSIDANNNEAISADFAVMTSGGGDTTPPTVSMTAPANGASVKGTVTVSANATDNIAVASVQFNLDGAALGAAISTAPYSMNWNTASAANGSHTLTAVATDTSNNSATSSAVTVTVSNTGTPGTVNNFANRSTGVNVPGGMGSIVSSQDFEKAIPTCTPTSPPCDTYAHGVQAYVTTYQAGSPSWDCTTSAEGNCSLKFVITSGSFQGDSGGYDYNFSPDLSKTFGNGQEFFIQYQTRWPAALFAAGAITNDDGLKHDITTEGDSPTGQADDCSNSPAEIVSISSQASFFGPIMYSNCGYSSGTFAFMQSGYQELQLPGLPGPNYLDQDAAGCPHYSGRGVPVSDPGCYIYQPDEWFTIQKHIKVGAFGSPNSVIEMWVAHANSPAVLVSNASDAAIVNTGAGKGANKYGKIQLSTYDTGATWNINSQVNFDNLIVSTRRIPDPNVAVPNAPDSLSLSVATGSVTVSWRVNSQNGTAQDDAGFLVERCTGNAPTCLANPGSGFAVIGTTGVGASSYQDSTTVAGTTYTYRVRAKNASGNSAYAIAICFNGGATCGGTAVAK